jgi:hypothetical protein
VITLILIKIQIILKLLDQMDLLKKTLQFILSNLNLKFIREHLKMFHRFLMVKQFMVLFTRNFSIEVYLIKLCLVKWE